VSEQLTSSNIKSLNSSSKLLIIYFYLTVIALNSEIIGQNITGIVTFEKKALIGANIVLTELDTTTLLTYDITDDKGNWSITEENIKDKILKISYLGCKDIYIYTSDIEDIDASIIINLESEKSILPDVVISDTRIGIVNKGDTIVYDLRTFKTDGDTELRHVMAKLPGVEIDQNGQIKYNGKKIDKLLIEGKDILQDQHRLVGESLRAEDVYKIEIIERYRSFRELFSKDHSEKVALNLILTESAKSKINGEIESQIGIENKYLVKGTVYKVSNKASNATFARSNNAGEPTFTAVDYLSLQPSLGRALEKAGGNINNLVPTEFVRPQDATDNTEHFLTTTTDMKVSNKVDLKLSALGSNANRKSRNTYSRVFLLPTESSMNGTNMGHIKLYYINLSSNLKIKLNQNLNLEIDIPFEYKQPNSDVINVGFWDQLPFMSENHFQRKGTKFSPQLYCQGKIGAQWNFGLSSFFADETSNGILELSDPFELFNSNIMQMKQNSNLRTQSWSSRTYIECSLKNIIAGLSHTYTHDFTEYSLQNNLSIEKLDQGKQNIIDNAHESEAYFNFDNKKVLIKSSIKIKSYSRTLDEFEHKKFVHPVTSLLLKYSFSKLHFFLLKANANKDFVSKYQSWTLDEVLDTRTTNRGYENPFHEIRTKGFMLSYLNFNLTTKRRYHVQADINETTNPLIMGAESKGSFIQFSPYIGKSAELFKIAGMSDQPISKYISVKLKLDYSIHKNKLIDESLIQFRTIGAEFSLTSSWKKLINIDLRYKRQISEQKIRKLNNNGAIDEIKLATTVNKSKIRFENDLSLNLLKTNLATQSVRFIKWDASFQYKIKSNFTFIVQGRDILNLKQREIINTVFRENYFEFQNYLRFPGNITTGIKWTF
jgi:hypothetical protein